MFWLPIRILAGAQRTTVCSEWAPATYDAWASKQMLTEWNRTTYAESKHYVYHFISSVFRAQVHAHMPPKTPTEKKTAAFKCHIA